MLSDGVAICHLEVVFLVQCGGRSVLGENIKATFCKTFILACFNPMDRNIVAIPLPNTTIVLWIYPIWVIH